MKPEQLAGAKAKAELWKAAPLDDKTNAADMPDEWVGKPAKTASIDMKKAIRNIQAILNNNGFDAGAPDGEMGKKTVGAIKAFQKSVGQKETGEIDDAISAEDLAEFLLASWEGAILRMKVSRDAQPLQRFKTIVFATVFKDHTHET